jgi:hypothetical protein
MSGHRIITENPRPPVPGRECDWIAYLQGHEDQPGAWGWGATKEQAIADLFGNLSELLSPHRTLM